MLRAFLGEDSVAREELRLDEAGDAEGDRPMVVVKGGEDTDSHDAAQDRLRRTRSMPRNCPSQLKNPLRRIAYMFKTLGDHVFSMV